MDGFFRRKVHIQVINCSQWSSLIFAGEFFNSGGWVGPRVEEVCEDACIELESNSWTSGLSGYVTFRNSDHSQFFCVVVSFPLLGSCCFTARFGADHGLRDPAGLLENAPPLLPADHGLTRAEGCTWEALDVGVQDMAVIRCVLLPNKMKRLSEDFSSALKNAAWCATSSEDGTAATRLGRRSGRITERRLEVEIENQSSESFLFDNDWFKHGSWVDGAVDCLPPGTTTTLKLCNSDFTSGVSGLFWYVNEARFDVYLSLVFSHPLASEAAFDAFLGAPPAELHSEWCQAPPVSSESNRHGCQWRVLERGPVLRLKVTLPESLPRAASGLPMPEAEQRVLVVRGEAQAQAQQGREESEVTAPSFMDVTRPRDFIDGVGSGLTAASVGFAAGGAALVAAPAVGLSEGGVPGFVLGLAQGGAAALGLAACGTAACAAQVARGMLNTPEALMQQDGTRWDSTRGKWVDDFVNLREEEAQADKAPEDCESEEDSPLFGSAYKKEVADSSYYDIIGVKPGSLPADIKKAYYKALLQVHPDKNPGDEEAHVKFQQLSAAYRVLSDPQLRERYDQIGEEATKEAELPSIDPILFFGILFGSEHCEKYIGKLYLAMQTNQLAKELQRQSKGGEDSLKTRGERQMQLRQHLREVRCARHLRHLVDVWAVQRDGRNFVRQSSEEASCLNQCAFGGRLLKAISQAYQTTAEDYLSSLYGPLTLESQLSRWSHGFQDAQLKTSAGLSLAKAAYAANTVAASVHRRMSEKNLNASYIPEGANVIDSKIAESLEGQLPIFLQTLWDVCLLDITSTLKNVSGKVVKDVSVPWQLRVRRAQALLRLARIFRDAGQREASDTKKAEVAKQLLEEALMGSVKR